MNKKSKQSKGKSNYKKRPVKDEADVKGAKASSRYETEVSTSKDGAYDRIKSNDIEWWNKTPLYDDATRVPFNRIYGDPISRNFTLPANASWLGSAIGGIKEEAAIPGIMTIDFAPTLGTTGDSNSPVNRAFTSLYGQIYSRTTGAMQFQQADLAFFVTSFASIASLIAVVKRALGVSQLYAGLNYYYPILLLKSMGIDPATVIGHQDEIRMRLNDAILSFNNLKIPDFMSIYKRQYALCHNVYADEDDVQAQLYLFRPVGYYKYHEVDTRVTPAGPSYLSFETISYASLHDIYDFCDWIDQCLNVWRNSSDLGIIAGSIQRAFSDSELITLDYVMGTEAVVPQVDRNITWQINNSRSMDVDLATLEVDQDPVSNLLVCKPKRQNSITTFGANTYQAFDCMMGNWILNSYDNETGPEFQMEATRLLPIYPDVADNLDIKNWNTEIVVGYATHTAERNATGVIGDSFWNFVSNLGLVAVTNSISLPAYNGHAQAVARLSKFKNGPRISEWTYATAGTSPTTLTLSYMGEIGDLYRATTIDRDALIGLNKAALQSVYQTDLPVLGK